MVMFPFPEGNNNFLPYSFSWKWKWKLLGHVRLFVTPWTWNSQARILEWVAFPFFRGSSQPWDRTQVSCIAGGFFTSWATGKPKSTGVDSYPFSSGSSWLRNPTGISHTDGRFFTNWAIREAPLICIVFFMPITNSSHTFQEFLGIIFHKINHFQTLISSSLFFPLKQALSFLV